MPYADGPESLTSFAADTLLACPKCRAAAMGLMQDPNFVAVAKRYPSLRLSVCDDCAAAMARPVTTGIVGVGEKPASFVGVGGKPGAMWQIPESGSGTVQARSIVASGIQSVGGGGGSRPRPGVVEMPSVGAHSLPLAGHGGGSQPSGGAKRAAALTASGIESVGGGGAAQARPGVVTLPASMTSLPLAGHGSQSSGAKRAVSMTASGIEAAAPPSVAVQHANAYAVRKQEAADAFQANLRSGMPPHDAMLVELQQNLSDRQALHYSPPEDPDNSALIANIAVFQGEVDDEHAGREQDRDPRDRSYDNGYIPAR